MSSPAGKKEKKKENSPVELDQTGLIPGTIIKPLLACISRMKNPMCKEPGLYLTPDTKIR